jgi:hypothetical protein
MLLFITLMPPFICFVLAGWEGRVHIVGKRLKKDTSYALFSLGFSKTIMTGESTTNEGADSRQVLA